MGKKPKELDYLQLIDIVKDCTNALIGCKSRTFHLKKVIVSAINSLKICIECQFQLFKVSFLSNHTYIESQVKKYDSNTSIYINKSSVLLVI